MSFNSDENDDEALMKAIQASLEDMKQKTTTIDSDNESISDESISDESISDESISDESISDESISDESISDEINIISISSEDEIQPIPNETINQTNDDDITRAIQTSLVDYQTTEDNLLNDIIKKSLDTIEDDKKRKFEKEKQLQHEEDKILSKVIEESYLSNVVIQQSNASIISNSQNSQNSQTDYVEDYQEDYEEEYMKMVLQQIREQEEKESKTKKIQQMRTIREEQDFEYEETLQKDIEKEREREKEKKNNDSINSITLNSIINNSSVINTHIPLENKSESETKSENNEEEKPKTLEEIRKARLAFFEKK